MADTSFTVLEAVPENAGTQEELPEWITVRKGADLCDVPYNDIVTLINGRNFLESRKEGFNRLLRTAEVLEKREQIRNFPRVRRKRRAAAV